jgi:hypothetical protein
MHRQIIGANATFEVDHINNNSLDNRRENLRVCTRQQNMFNCSKRSGTSSKYKGVHFHRKANKWQATISVDHKIIYLGLYSTEMEACLVRDRAAVKYHGDFAKLNIASEVA